MNGKGAERVNGRMQWLATGSGRALLAEEARQVAVALESVFGDQVLQIGRWGPAGLFTRYARTRRRAILAAAPGPGVDLVSALDNLAVASDSVDAVLLPHVLETADDPYGILRDVDRILRPDGHVIVLGFNAIGWWGARHYLSRHRFPSGVQRMLSEHRMRDWLRLLSYNVQPAMFYHYEPPLIGPGYGPRYETPEEERPAGGEPELEGPEPTGDVRALPPSAAGRLLHRFTRAKVFAGGYLLVARKEVLTVTPIRPAFRRRTRLVGGLVNPTTRNAA